MCFSTQDYNEWMDKHYPNNDDGEKKKFLSGFVMNVKNIESL